MVTVGIAALILANKMDVIRFINKHNIKWFEHQRSGHKQSNSEQLQQPLPTIITNNSNKNIYENNRISNSNNNNATRMIEHLANSLYVDDYDRSESNKANILSIKTTEIVSTTTPSPSPTIPSIILRKETTTKFTPAWKNLINNAVKSNKNIDMLERSNSVETVDETPPTVLQTTKLFVQKSTTTAAPTTQSRGMFIFYSNRHILA